MSEAKKKLMSAALRVLNPLVRILLRYEISHTEFVELAKRAYVDVAYDYFTIPKRKQTYSRVSVLTGLSRKEVMRLAEGRETQIEKAKGSINRAARVIQGWVTDVDFLDANRQPLVLPLRGELPSFETLVERYSGDITARAILDELIRIGAAEKIGKESVKLNQLGYIPDHEDPEKIELFTTHAGDMLETGAHNLSPECNKPRLQQQLTYHEIPESVIREFETISREKSVALLNELNQWLADKKTNVKPQPGEATGRVGLGIYYLENLKKEE